jgi:hypothetical protein
MAAAGLCRFANNPRELEPVTLDAGEHDDERNQETDTGKQGD